MASTAVAYIANAMNDCGCFHAPAAASSTSQGLPLGLTQLLFSSSSR